MRTAFGKKTVGMFFPDDCICSTLDNVSEQILHSRVFSSFAIYLPRISNLRKFSLFCRCCCFLATLREEDADMK